MWRDRYRSASCVWLGPINVNRSGSGVESCTMAYGVDIVGECLHYSIRTGPGMMKFGGSALGRVRGMQHHLIARLAGGPVRVRVVGVGLMALDEAKKITSNFLGEASLLYAICNDLWGWVVVYRGLGDRRVGGVLHQLRIVLCVF